LSHLTNFSLFCDKCLDQGVLMVKIEQGWSVDEDGCKEPIVTGVALEAECTHCDNKERKEVW